MEEQTAPERIRILLAMPFPDAQPIVVRFSAEEERGLDVVSVTGDGATIFTDAKEHDVDVVVLSPQVRNYDGEIIQRLLHYDPKPILTIAAVPLTGDWAATMERSGAKAHINLPFNKERLDKLLAMIPSLLKQAYQERTSAYYIPHVDTELAEALARRGFQRQVVTVWAPKGGVGKTFLLTNLGALLGIVANRPTLIIDADMNGGDVFAYIHQGLSHFNRTIFSLAEDFSLDGNLSGGMLKRNVTHYQSNLDVLVGIARMHQSGRQSMLGKQGEAFGKALLETARRVYDFVLVDLGADYNRPLHMQPLLASDLILLIVTPNLISRYHARNCMEDLTGSLSVPREHFQLVVNKFAPDVGASRKDIQKDIELPELGMIPFDLDVFRSLNEGVPIVFKNPRGEVSSALAQIGATIYPPLEVIWEKRSGRKKKEFLKRGFLGRLFG